MRIRDVVVSSARRTRFPSTQRPFREAQSVTVTPLGLTSSSACTRDMAGSATTIPVLAGGIPAAPCPGRPSQYRPGTSSSIRPASGPVRMTRSRPGVRFLAAGSGFGTPAVKRTPPGRLGSPGRRLETGRVPAWASGHVKRAARIAARSGPLVEAVGLITRATGAPEGPAGGTAAPGAGHTAAWITKKSTSHPRNAGVATLAGRRVTGGTAAGACGKFRLCTGGVPGQESWLGSVHCVPGENMEAT